VTLIHRQDLLSFFPNAARVDRLVGAELEVAGFDARTGLPVGYSGPRGVETVLQRIAERKGLTPIHEDSHIIGVESERGRLTIEPGGQVELSTRPHTAATMLSEDVSYFRGLLNEAAEGMDIGWIAIGMNPVSSWEQVELVPKKRYDIMTAYLREHGARSLDMMRRTQSVHVTLDYADEAEAQTLVRVANLASPLVAGIFAHSPIGLGKVLGPRSERTLIWRETDPDRCGLDREAIEGTWSYGSYLDRLLETPLIFVVDGEHYLDAQGIRAGEFFEKGFGDRLPAVEDLEWVINQTFPDVRIRQYIELRGADMPPLDCAPALAAVWVALLYDEQAQAGVVELLGDLSFDQVLELQAGLAREGLGWRDGRNRLGQELAESLLSLASDALERRGHGEASLLTPVQDLVHEGKTPADRLVEAWEGPLQQDPVKLVSHLAV
jgi:glutamate--cysteine ligase